MDRPKFAPVTINSKAGSYQVLPTDNDKFHDINWKMKIGMALDMSPDQIQAQDLVAMLEDEINDQIEFTLWGMTKSSYEFAPDASASKPHISQNLHVTQTRHHQHENDREPFQADYEIQGAISIDTAVPLSDDQSWMTARNHAARHAARFRLRAIKVLHDVKIDVPIAVDVG